MKNINLKVEHFIQQIDMNDYNNNYFLKNNYLLEELNLNICGITCLEMCIHYYRGYKENLATLTEKAIKNNILTIGTGCVHYRLIELAREYNLEGCLIREERQDRFLTLLNFMLSNNHLVIASVTPGILKGNSKPKGGHLVLLRGFDVETNNLLINDPSFLNNYSITNGKVEVGRFFDNFSGNMIVLSEKSSNIH